MTEVPPLHCNGCRKCCLGDTIYLMPQDNPASFKTVAAVDPNGAPARALAKGKDGECVYLGKRGCQRYASQPHMCRVYDCRKTVLGVFAKQGAPGVEARLGTPPGQFEGFKEGFRRLDALGLAPVLTAARHDATRPPVPGVLHPPLSD